MASLLIHWLPPSAVHPSTKTPMAGEMVPWEISSSSRSGTLSPKPALLSQAIPLPEKPWRKYTTGKRSAPAA